MGFGNYPPGCSGDMLEAYWESVDNSEPPRSCENCMYYEETRFGHICGVLEAEYSGEELEAMTDDEYIRKLGKKPDDYCHDHEFWED